VHFSEFFQKGFVGVRGRKAGAELFQGNGKFRILSGKLITDFVVGPLRLFSALDDAGIFQDRQAAGGVGLGEGKRRFDLADA